MIYVMLMKINKKCHCRTLFENYRKTVHLFMNINFKLYLFLIVIIQVQRNCEALSECTSYGIYSIVKSSFDISVQINCNWIGEGLLYYPLRVTVWTQSFEESC
jgi:hypothetical protein